MRAQVLTIAELMATPRLLTPLSVYFDSYDSELREMLVACHNFLSLEIVDNDCRERLPMIQGVWLRESRTCVVPEFDGCTLAMLTIMPKATNEALVSALNRGMNLCLFRPVSKEVLRCALEQLREALSLHAHQARLYQRLLPLMTRLTPRERAVLAGLRQGQATKVLAGHLHVSEKTIQMYRSRLLKTFNAGSTTHLALLAAWWDQYSPGQLALSVRAPSSSSPSGILSAFKTAEPSQA